tara:strand:+ start:370 stop:720 length:351 start_codon:yes stop_codon:yes gene_type:complete
MKKSRLSNKELEKVSMERIIKAILNVNNNQKRMNIAVAPPLDDMWGFEFRPTNGNKVVYLVAEYVESKDSILWKSTNGKTTNSFQNKVQKYVNTMIALALNKLDDDGINYTNMKAI